MARKTSSKSSSRKSTSRKNPAAKTKIRGVTKQKATIDRAITSGVKSRRKEFAKSLDLKLGRQLDRAKIIKKAVDKALPKKSLATKRALTKALIGPSKKPRGKEDVPLLNPRMDKKKK